MNNVTTTTDTPSATSFVLRVRRSDAGWVVGDCVGNRFGHGSTIAEAVADWHADAAGLAKLEGSFAPLLQRERDWYQQVVSK